MSDDYAVYLVAGSGLMLIGAAILAPDFISRRLRMALAAAGVALIALALAVL